ncbi:cold-shock protein [Janibacter sp. Soil728]|uniref:Cold shock domain-containing protein n=1 Tax=Janibacter limosus TaxID=53458 RepID=A0A4P6MYG0_9MICO|nr:MULTISPECIES: cold shock domain-containing protein [Janibacter]KRE36024.1 cold-shock protein [Janibacter sp. Soil728]QBF47157.1 cold shock domain-containing protein [Janibacter limosus]
MPTGKVKWYDAEKGFGFISGDDGSDIFLHANALPEGTTTLKGGTRVDYGIVEGRRGAQALAVTVLDTPPSVSANLRQRDRKPAEDMAAIVEDVIKLLDDLGNGLRRGRYPDKAHGAKVAQVLRRIADDMEG